MAQSNQVLQVALTHMPLFPDAQSGGLAILMVASEVLGVPVELLEHARRLMMATGSLDPLRQLLQNPHVPKSEGLRYLLVGKMTKYNLGQPEQGICHRVTLQAHSSRGRVRLHLKAVLGSDQSGPLERRTIRISFAGSIQTASRLKSFKHEMILARDTPRRFQVWARAA